MRAKRARFGVCTVLNRKGNHTELAAAAAAAVSAQNYAVGSFRCSVFVSHRTTRTAAVGCSWLILYIFSAYLWKSSCGGKTRMRCGCGDFCATTFTHYLPGSCTHSTSPQRVPSQNLHSDLRLWCVCVWLLLCVCVVGAR